MIVARSWTAHATPEGARAFVAHFRDSRAPRFAQLPGYLGASIAERPVGDLIELVVVTRWASAEAIRAFAGDDPERAVVEPVVRAMLVSFDERAAHRTVVLELGPP
jgi:heme-degrading monooxygenase HmoA